MALLVAGQRAGVFAAALRGHAGDREIRTWPDIGRAEEIKYALAWRPPPGALKSLPRLELIVSAGAGVDHLLSDPELPEVSVVRFVDPDLTGRMAEYVALHTLLHHRRTLEFLASQAARRWTPFVTAIAPEIRVGLMGLGVMGQAAARALAVFGYALNGWSRTPRPLPGVTCYAGNDQLELFLERTDILVCLLPLTPETSGILDRHLISKLSRTGRSPNLPGPVLINAGRGGLQIESDILAALDEGRLYAASLDVFREEPLPVSSPLWSHPRVLITPHVASETDPDAIARYTLRQIARHERGEPLENIVARERGY